MKYFLVNFYTRKKKEFISKLFSKCFREAVIVGEMEGCNNFYKTFLIREDISICDIYDTLREAGIWGEFIDLDIIVERAGMEHIVRLNTNEYYNSRVIAKAFDDNKRNLLTVNI